MPVKGTSSKPKIVQKSFFGMGKIAPRPSKTPGYQRDNGEEREQKALIEWCDLYANRFPELYGLIHIPNGAFTPPGERGKMVGMGMRPGVWDLALFHRIEQWEEDESGRPYLYYSPGMIIEMKYGKNDLDPEQVRWRDFVEAQGWHCVVCRSWLEAAREILRWLDIKDRDMWEALR